MTSDQGVSSDQTADLVKPKPKSGWLNLLVDYGPVLVFFLTYRHFSPADRDNVVGEVASPRWAWRWCSFSTA